MAGLILRKPCYGVAELCQRWDVSELDIANFALLGELTFSATVTNLPIEEGTIEEVDEGQWVDIPDNYRRVSGTLDLVAEHAWTGLTQGWADVHAFKAPKGHYVCVRPLAEEDGYHRITKDRMVLRHEELRRFEMAQQVSTASAAAGASLVRRGPAPKYDWDAFWCEIAIRLYTDGLVDQKEELVEQMIQWFESRGEAPDASYIRKKIKPFWERLQAAVHN